MSKITHRSYFEPAKRKAKREDRRHDPDQELERGEVSTGSPLKSQGITEPNDQIDDKMTIG